MNINSVNTSGAGSVSLGIRLILFILLIIAIKLIKKRKKCGCPPLLGSTQGFNVENNTQSIAFTLTTASGDVIPPPGPLLPRNTVNFEVRSRTGHITRGFVEYTATAADGTSITVSFTLVNYGGVLTGVDDIKSTGPVKASAETTSGDDLITISDS